MEIHTVGNVWNILPGVALARYVAKALSVEYKDAEQWTSHTLRFCRSKRSTKFRQNPLNCGCNIDLIRGIRLPG